MWRGSRLQNGPTQFDSEIKLTDIVAQLVKASYRTGGPVLIRGSWVRVPAVSLLTWYCSSEWSEHRSEKPGVGSSILPGTTTAGANLAVVPAVCE